MLDASIVTIGPWFQELRISVGALQHVLYDLKAELLLLQRKQLGHTATTLSMPKSSVKIVLVEHLLIPTSSEISQTVKRQSSVIDVCT
jgi:hypothetical protein